MTGSEAWKKNPPKDGTGIPSSRTFVSSDNLTKGMPCYCRSRRMKTWPKLFEKVIKYSFIPRHIENQCFPACPKSFAIVDCLCHLQISPVKACNLTNPKYNLDIILNKLKKNVQPTKPNQTCLWAWFITFQIFCWDHVTIYYRRHANNYFLSRHPLNSLGSVYCPSLRLTW